MSFFTSESTSRASQNIDEILRENMEATHGERIAREGTIGPTPWHETNEGQDFLLSMVTGSPGSAIGRVSKAAITGGQVTNKVLRKLLKQKGKPTKGMDLSPGSMHGKLNQIKWDNKLNASRIKAQKIYDKYNIPHESEMVDPVTSILDILKRN